LLCHTKFQIMFEFDFDPLIFGEVMAHGLTKMSVFCSLIYIVTNQNLVLLCLNYFWLDITPVGDLEHVLLTICLYYNRSFYVVVKRPIINTPLNFLRN
jgi:hypothetical protein